MANTPVRNPPAASFPRVRQVLIVDGDLVSTNRLREALGRCGGQWQVRACQAGAQALDLLEMPRFYVDLALIDLGLPDISGTDVIRAIRHRFASTPVMVISRNSSERSLLAAIRSGACGYVLKDTSEEGIAASIEDVMRGDFPVSPSLARYLFQLAGSPMRLAAGDPFGLTPKERETLRLISRGHSYDAVASLMGVARSTIQSHVRNLYAKLNAHSKVQALSRARENGLL